MTKEEIKRVYGYHVVYSPYDGGWYITVSNQQGKEVWRTAIHEQKGMAISELKKSKYEKERLIFIGETS